MGSRSRLKGQRGEREAAKELSRLFGCDARRGQQYSGRLDSPDVAHDIVGVHVEVKRQEQLRIYDAIDQAVAEAGEGVPLLLHRRNNRPWLAVVRLDDLPRLATLLYLTLADNA